MFPKDSAQNPLGGSLVLLSVGFYVQVNLFDKQPVDSKLIRMIKDIVYIRSVYRSVVSNHTASCVLDS